VTNVHHALYEQECALRFQLLRVPLGIVHENAEKFDFEDDAYHWVALAEHDVVGCVLLYAHTPKAGKLFQMAVAEKAQGRGIGAMLVQHLEEKAQERDCKTIEMHARLVAVDFYRKLGYRTTGPIFSEVGIPHLKMTKEI
jgi:hypothetical protein